MGDVPVLWQFTASHFNEKVRWGLDWKGIAYERRSMLPGLQIVPVLWMTGQRSVPVLVLHGKAIADSTRILEAIEREWPEPPLLPADPSERALALELEDLFDRELGPHVRRAAFHLVLDDADFCCALFSQDAGPLLRRAYRTLFPAVRVAMRLDMGIDDERAALSRARVAAMLDRIERQIGASGHLVGDAFSIADLTGAALLAPFVQPPEFPYAWPPFPAAAESQRAEIARHPAARWAAEMYRRYRRRSPARVATAPAA